MPAPLLSARTQSSRKEALAADSAEKRLEFLMSQAEIFNHFVHDSGGSGGGLGAGAGAGTGASAGAGAGSAAGKRGARGKHTEKQEDAELVEDAARAEGGSAGGHAKLTKQPSLVQGTMRDYQLEG